MNLNGFGEFGPSYLVKGWTFFGWKPFPSAARDFRRKDGAGRDDAAPWNCLSEPSTKAGWFKMTIAGSAPVKLF